MNKKLLYTVIFLCAGLNISAQEVSLSTSGDTADSISSIVDKINSTSNIHIIQSEALAKRVEKPNHSSEYENGLNEHENATPIATRSGYRIQVFDDNNPRTARNEATAKRNQIVSRFPNLRAYVTFNSPYWRVKVGDFRSHSEAELVLNEIKQAFPSLSGYMRIVRDRIHIYE